MHSVWFHLYNALEEAKLIYIDTNWMKSVFAWLEGWNFSECKRGNNRTFSTGVNVLCLDGIVTLLANTFVEITELYR